MIYEYHCGNCDKILQLSFPFARNPEAVVCHLCGSAAVRFFGAVPPIHFKGGGWASKSELDAMDPKNNDPTDFSDITGV